MGVYGYFRCEIVINLYKHGGEKYTPITKEELVSLKNAAEKKMKRKYPSYRTRFWEYVDDEGSAIKLKEKDYWNSPTIVVAELLIILKQLYDAGFFIDDTKTSYDDDKSAGCMKCVDVDQKNVQISFFDTDGEIMVANGRVGFIRTFDFEDLKAPNLVDHCINKPCRPVFTQ